MICETMAGDNRFEIIAKAKHAILEGTNIDTSEDEMKVLDNFLFRCWQMGWLDKYDDSKPKTGEWIYAKEQLEIVPMWECSCCKIRMPKKFNYCPNCGAKIFKGGDSE